MNKEKGNTKLLFLAILWLALIGVVFLASCLIYFVVYYLPQQVELI